MAPPLAGCPQLRNSTFPFHLMLILMNFRVQEELPLLSLHGIVLLIPGEQPSPTRLSLWFVGTLRSSEHKTRLFELQWADGQNWHCSACRTRYKGQRWEWWPELTLYCMQDEVWRTALRGKGRKKLSHPSCPTGHPHHSLRDAPLMQALSEWQVGSGLGLDIRAQAWNEGLKQIKVLADIIKTSPKRYSNKQSWTFS